MITDADASLLEQSGWVVECMSPLEARHSGGSFASLNGVCAVAQALRAGESLDWRACSEIRDTDEQVLKSMGWSVESWAPFELRKDDDGSRATCIAASVVLESCRHAAEHRDESEEDFDAAVMKRADNLAEVVRIARVGQNDGDEANRARWRRVLALLRDAGIR